MTGVGSHAIRFSPLEPTNFHRALDRAFHERLLQKIGRCRLEFFLRQTLYTILRHKVPTYQGGLAVLVGDFEEMKSDKLTFGIVRRRVVAGQLAK